MEIRWVVDGWMQIVQRIEEEGPNKNYNLYLYPLAASMETNKSHPGHFEWVYTM